MKLNALKNLFKPKQEKKIIGDEDENPNKPELTQEEMLELDKHVGFYHTNIINSLILYTYDARQLDEMAPILMDPLAELYEELDYAFLPILLETVFRNKLIDESFKEELLDFRKKVDDIPIEIWGWDFLNTHEAWKNIRMAANELLHKLNVETRDYSTKYFNNLNTE